jgi:hypothetical protein
VLVQNNINTDIKMPPRSQGERSQTITHTTEQSTLVGIAQSFADREVSANRQLPKRPDTPLAEEFVRTFLDSAFEAGLDEDFRIESPEDTERVAKNRRIRSALTWASGQALRVLDQKVETAKNDSDYRNAVDERTVIQEGSERLFELFGIVTQPVQQKVITQEIPVVGERGPVKPVQIRAMEAMNAVDQDISKSYDAMAASFTEFYIKGQATINELRPKYRRGSRLPKKQQLEAEQMCMQTVASMNVYTHRLGNMFEILDDPFAQRGYAKKLQKTVARIAQGKDYIDERSEEQILFNQMMTGLSLEISSLRDLRKAAKEFGWTEVRSSTIKEDVKDQTDLFITVNGKHIPVDIKSSHSFEKQIGSTTKIDGIKIKKNKDGVSIIVVDAQRLGNPDRDNDQAFEFENGYAVANAVNLAITAMQHPISDTIK